MFIPSRNLPSTLHSSSADPLTRTFLHLVQLQCCHTCKRPVFLSLQLNTTFPTQLPTTTFTRCLFQLLQTLPTRFFSFSRGSLSSMQSNSSACVLCLPFYSLSAAIETVHSIPQIRCLSLRPSCSPSIDLSFEPFLPHPHHTTPSSFSFPADLQTNRCSSLHSSLWSVYGICLSHATARSHSISQCGPSSIHLHASCYLSFPCFCCNCPPHVQWLSRHQASSHLQTTSKKTWILFCVRVSLPSVNRMHILFSLFWF